MIKPTILIVDDEKKFTDTFAQFLAQRFHVDVLVRNNAVEGIKVLDTRRVDVLFQDIMMPGLKGEEVIEHIKKRGLSREMIVFIISKWNEDTRTQKFEKDGVKYIPKPISLIITQKVLAEEFKARGKFDYRKRV